MHLLLLQPAGKPLGEQIASVGRDCGWTVAHASSFRDALETAGGSAPICAAIVPAPAPGSTGEYREFDNLLRILESRRIATLVVTDGKSKPVDDDRSLLETVPTNVTTDELRGRLAMIRRYHGLVGRLEQELHNMERLSKRLNLHFRDIDQEMRLAGRLQRDFLPNTSEPIGNLRFASIYRPASWVSGDLFDIFRIDEKHSGVYIADAVGHGLAAGLLTMFIKRAVTPKQIEEFGYTILDPARVMSGLNETLADQALPQCQFVTACYALINHESLEIQFARGGHPHPILITREGVVSEVKTSGGLLGLFKGEEFPSHSLNLRGGDKIIFYTDGVELLNDGSSPGEHSASAFMAHLLREAKQPIESMMASLERRLDGHDGSLHPKDDITVLGMEVA